MLFIDLQIRNEMEAQSEATDVQFTTITAIVVVVPHYSLWHIDISVTVTCGHTQHTHSCMEIVKEFWNFLINL